MSKQIVLEFYPEWDYCLPLTLPDGVELGSDEAREFYVETIENMSDAELASMTRDMLQGGFNYEEVEQEPTKKGGDDESL